MSGVKKYFSLGRLGLFLWMGLIVFVGLYQGGDPTNWSAGSQLEQFAAYFPTVFAFLAAILLLPLYALSTVLKATYMLGFSLTEPVLMPIFLLLGVVYLYWLSGVIERNALTSSAAQS